jgi:hypothetical protein
MDWFSELRCFDQRDSIFALLAISKDASALKITVDYSPSNTISKQFRQLSNNMLLLAVDLRFLVDVCGSDNLSDPQQPSWALATPCIPGLQANAVVSNIFSPHPLKLLRSPLIFRLDYTILVLKGHILDSVSLCTPRLYMSKSFLLSIDDVEYLRTLSDRLMSWSKLLIYTGITLKNASLLCEAILSDPYRPANTGGAGMVTVDDAFRFYSYFALSFLQTRNLATSLGVDMNDELETFNTIVAALLLASEEANGVKTFPSIDNPSHEMDQTFEVMNTLIFTSGKTFGVTEKNRIFNGMNEVAQGDVVAAFEGSDTLWILRPAAEGRYRLIGDAYVHGLMDGEAYEGLNPDDVDYEIEII